MFYLLACLCHFKLNLIVADFSNRNFSQRQMSRQNRKQNRKDKSAREPVLHLVPPYSVTGTPEPPHSCEVSACTEKLYPVHKIAALPVQRIAGHNTQRVDHGR